MTGQLLPADEVANLLRQEQASRATAPRSLYAYHLVDGEPVQIPPREWDGVASKLAGLKADLRAEFPNDDQGSVAWDSRSVALLPDGVFVWLDEFEEFFFDEFSEDRVSFTDERKGERALNFMPLMSDDERSIVLAGFEELPFGLDETQTIFNDEDVSDVAELTRNGEPIDWQYWANRQGITPQQAARLAHCIDPIIWPADLIKHGQMPEALRIEIQRLSEWLNEREQSWSLSAIGEALGEDALPFSMKKAIQQQRQEEVHEGEQSNQSQIAKLDGLSKHEIIAVDWPLLGDFTQASLKNALSDVPAWLLPARVAKGARGRGKGSALWNPALIAEGLVEKGYANRKAMTAFIRGHFYDWFGQWESLQAYS